MLLGLPALTRVLFESTLPALETDTPAQAREELHALIDTLADEAVPWVLRLLRGLILLMMQRRDGPPLG